MSILSIDVGIKNLAMCLIEESTKHVLEWDVSGVPPMSSLGLFVQIRNHLDERPWVLNAKTILIERQPGQNKTMKSVENFLHSYFIIKCPKSETIIYHAHHKVPDVVGRGKTMYKQRKQTSIDRCREFIKEEPNRHWMKTFVESKKKDDLADTVLQALSFINRRDGTSNLPGVNEYNNIKLRDDPEGRSSNLTRTTQDNGTQDKNGTQEKIKPVKLVARKPNENQIATKYSKSNLAWFVKNKTEAELLRDKRFIKDLGKFYKNISELKAEMGV
jgi:hypothetical protein